MVRVNSLRAAELVSLAAQPVRLDGGTPYPVTAHELLDTKNLAPASRVPRTCTADRALEEVLERNAVLVRALVPQSTANAISRLRGGLSLAVSSAWGPDLIIKMFADTDLVFFNGKLLGDAVVGWRDIPMDRYGECWSLPHGQARINLNRAPLCMRLQGDAPEFFQMFGTMLHEMCHAYFMVRCSTRAERKIFSVKEGHGVEFNTMMRAVVRTARIVFGVVPLENESPELVRGFILDMERDHGLGQMGNRNAWPNGGPAGPMYTWYPRYMDGPQNQFSCGGCPCDSDEFDNGFF